MIPYGKQQISEADKAAILEVLDSDWLTQGPKVPQFEQAVCHYLGNEVKAIAVTNGTNALHLAYAALNVQLGDKVWVSTMTFVASANAARYCGADVEFLDIDPRTYNLDVKALEKKLKCTDKADLPKVVCAIDFAGQSADFKMLRKLSEQYGFKILEDACHAFGGNYLGNKIGSCEYSDVAVLSFHPVKCMTTAEGGMLLTRDENIEAAAKRLRSHGISREPDDLAQTSHGPWYYEQGSLGFNYRMTDLQAALGISQLTRLDEFIEERRTRARVYDLALADLPVIRPYQDPESDSAYHLYPIQVSDESPVSRAELFEYCRAAGIGVNVHYIPVHTQPYFQALGAKWGDCPVAEGYYQRAMTLPLYPTLPEKDQEFVISTLIKGLSG